MSKNKIFGNALGKKVPKSLLTLTTNYRGIYQKPRENPVLNNDHIQHSSNSKWRNNINKPHYFQ